MAYSHLSGIQTSASVFSTATIGTATVTTMNATTATATTGTATTFTPTTLKFATGGAVNFRVNAKKLSDTGFSNVLITSLSTADFLVAKWFSHSSDGGVVSAGQIVGAIAAAGRVSFTSALGMTNGTAFVMWADVTQ